MKFSFSNPTKIQFGQGQIASINTLIPKEQRVLVLYGGGSIKKNGVYDQVESALDGYTWEAFGGVEPNPTVDVADERKLCPEGFRVATDDDWKELERHIGVAVEELHREGWRGDNDVAITLKAQQPDSWLKHFDKTKINAHQFNARPAGVKVGNWYLTQGVYTEFWTSSSASEKEAFARSLACAWWNSHKGEIRRAKLNKNYMFSVRCVKEA